MQEKAKQTVFLEAVIVTIEDTAKKFLKTGQGFGPDGFFVVQDEKTKEDKVLEIPDFRDHFRVDLRTYIEVAVQSLQKTNAKTGTNFRLQAIVLVSDAYLENPEDAIVRVSKGKADTFDPSPGQEEAILISVYTKDALDLYTTKYGRPNGRLVFSDREESRSHQTGFERLRNLWPANA